jgi:dTDP-4-dehydrorhamnose 3,5-epimerase
VPITPSGPILIAPAVHGDERGFFVETFRKSVLSEMGVARGFVQGNQSRQGIGSGMHYQPGHAKLVRWARGAILDVLVGVRRGSPQFGEWGGEASTYYHPGAESGFAYHDPAVWIVWPEVGELLCPLATAGRQAGPRSRRPSPSATSQIDCVW